MATKNSPQRLNNIWLMISSFYCVNWPLWLLQIWARSWWVMVNYWKLIQVVPPNHSYSVQHSLFTRADRHRLFSPRVYWSWKYILWIKKRNKKNFATICDREWNTFTFLSQGYINSVGLYQNFLQNIMSIHSTDQISWAGRDRKSGYPGRTNVCQNIRDNHTKIHSPTILVKILGSKDLWHVTTTYPS